MAEPTRSDWDPRDPSVLSDQQRAYDEMRSGCPVAYSDFLGWSVFTHHEVVGAVRDTGTFSSATKRHAISNGRDPPEHTVYRLQGRPRAIVSLGSFALLGYEARLASYPPAAATRTS
jgi:hypothetical protein